VGPNKLLFYLFLPSIAPCLIGTPPLFFFSIPSSALWMKLAEGRCVICVCVKKRLDQSVCMCNGGRDGWGAGGVVRDRLILANTKFPHHLSIRSINNHIPHWLTRSRPLPRVYESRSNRIQQGMDGGGGEEVARRPLGRQVMWLEMAGNAVSWQKKQWHTPSSPTVLNFVTLKCS